MTSSLKGNSCREATQADESRESFRNNDELTRRTDQTARQRSDSTTAIGPLRLTNDEVTKDDLCPGGAQGARPYS
jgi:hypothetical protein